MKRWVTLWKLKRLRKKIDKVFDELGCDEIFYIRATGELYGIWWNNYFANLRDITDDKDERVKLIKQYQELKDEYNGLSAS